MSKTSPLRRLLWVLRQPGGLRGLLAWKPFSLTAFWMLRILQNQDLTFRTLIDGGANIGQFARATTELFPEARIVAVEARPDAAARLRANLADRAQVTVLPSALGNHSGTLTFYRTPHPPDASALPPRSTPDTPEPEQIEVPVERLDAVLAGEPLEPPVLLKLDLQGSELEALKGAPETLRRCTYVLLELSFKPMYEDELLFDEVHAFMRAAGFHFLRPLDVTTDDDGGIVQMDALFAREAQA